MTETHNVSIDEVRALVVERQRYDDWLAALAARRDETPERVFDRVLGDYVARRLDVIDRLRAHVNDLASLGGDLGARLESLESRLSGLEDERAEAMLRTAVGEFDSDRWEQVRQNVEAQIAELGEQRAALQIEGDEVRTLLASARHEPDVPDAPHAVAETPDIVVANEMVTEVIASAELLPIDAFIVDESPMLTSTETAAAADLAELENALSVFSNPAPTAAFEAPPPQSAPVTRTPLLDGVDVFDDSELGDLRMSPPAQATATATPPASKTNVASGAATREAFDDLAFLRSVVDPATQAGVVRAAGTTDQQKTLRCTECSTMNLPTEWYCERCGGELAAF